MIIVYNDTIITGSKDKSIRGLPLREKEIKIKTFEINYAHEGEVTYLMNLYHDEIISCGVDGRIKRWYNRNSDFEGFLKYELLETFSINGQTKVHNSVNKIIKLRNNNLCSCGNDSTIKIWVKDYYKNKYELNQIFTCLDKNVNSILEIDNNLVAGCLNNTQFFNLDQLKFENNLENTSTYSANSMIKMKDKIICGNWGIFFIDKNTKKLLKTIKIINNNLEAIFCLTALNDNLFICGGKLGTIDIYDINAYEKIASTYIKDESIYGIKNFDDIYFFYGSKNIFFMILEEFKRDVYDDDD